MYPPSLKRASRLITPRIFPSPVEKEFFNRIGRKRTLLPGGSGRRSALRRSPCGRTSIHDDIALAGDAAPLIEVGAHEGGELGLARVDDLYPHALVALAYRVV
jgi:hypothetical protein